MNLKVSSTVEVSSLLRKKSTKTSSSVFGPFPEFIKLDFNFYCATDNSKNLNSKMFLIT